MFRSILLLTVTLMTLTIDAYPQDRSYGRSMVITDHGIVATSHYLASQAGAQILSRGGSAMDAAIAANAVLGVTEPMMNGIGGDLFLIYWDAKSSKLYGLNASGWAPQKLTPAYLNREGFHTMPGDGIHSVTVPGTVDGWSKAHQRFGKLAWKDLFSPAIYYARNGYAVPEVVHQYWSDSVEKLQKTPEATRVFLPGGKAPQIGEKFVNPDLARTLTLVAQQGRDSFYKGEIAQAIVNTSSAMGGTMRLEDLGEFSSEWVEPISSNYSGWTIYELPPNGQGMAALEMLNIMAQFQPDQNGPASAPELHKRMEAMKLAYADLYKYNADPKFSKIPVAGLLSAEHASQRASLIDPGKANCNPGAGAVSGSDTTYLSVVDKEGNIVSLIQSNYSSFGSGVVVKGGGFALQNRGGLFTLEAGHPNVLAPRKRPFHTIIPAFMERGDVHIGFGIMGGANQPLAHAQFVSNFVDYGMNIQAALEAPRFTVTSGAVTCDLFIESRISPEVVEALKSKGHNLLVRKEYSAAMGRGQAVLHNSKTKMNYAASDPRADGVAEPETPQNW